MLKQHLNSIEARLTQDYEVSNSAGHNVIKGTEREHFIATFLENHLSQTVAIGTGIIIDHATKPGDKKNQHDIVIFKKQYPKLNFGLANAFFVESVVATIEVKSVLDTPSLDRAIEVAAETKKMQKSEIKTFTAGDCPPKVLNYVVAYTSKLSIDTIKDRVISEHSKMGYVKETYNSNEERTSIPSNGLDGVFILNKGFIAYDNAPLSIAPQLDENQYPATMKWVRVQSETGNLLYLFLLLQAAVSNMQGVWLNPVPYVQKHGFTDTSFHFAR